MKREDPARYASHYEPIVKLLRVGYSLILWRGPDGWEAAAVMPNSRATDYCRDRPVVPCIVRTLFKNGVLREVPPIKTALDNRPGLRCFDLNFDRCYKVQVRGHTVNPHKRPPDV